MAQQHLDRLTSTDAGFLHQEGPNSHMHIGGVLIFDGPPPKLEDLLNHVRGRLHLIPRYRQKLATPPLEAGRPLWIDDNSFNLEYHVRNAALPAPGSFDQLMRLAARIASHSLDRTKPLWEFWLVEGLEPAPGSDVERFAMISKTHHSLIDGISGMDLATVLLDLTPEPAVVAEGLEPWQPHPEPTPGELMFAGIKGAMNAAVGLGVRAISAASQPSRSLETVRDAAEGVGEIVWAILNPAPETPLNVKIGPHRRFSVVSQSLDDYKAIKNRFGTTINDVMLAVVAGALSRWLRSRGLRTDGVELRALVPVSVRTPDQHADLGNRLALMRAPLPVYVGDAAARLDVVKTEMGNLKASKQAYGALTIAAMNDIAPPAVLAQISKLQFSTRLFNLLVTNIPGPQLPLYILGRELQDMYPLAFLPENQALAVAVFSYNGRMEYGLLGDFDALPDIDVIAAGIDDSLQELLEAVDTADQPPARRVPLRAVPDPARTAARGRRSAGAPGPKRDSKPGPVPRRRPTRPAAARPTLAPDPTPGAGGPDGQAPTSAGLDQQLPSILPSARHRSTTGPAAEMRAKRASRGQRRPPQRPEADA